MPPHETAYFLAPGREPGGPGHRLAYYEWGDAANPRVLFCVHGLTRNAMDFAPLAESLCDHWRVIAVDMPGRGRSDWLPDPADYAYPTYLADLIALLDHLAVDQVDWLGTSMGGILGMLMAGVAPGRVRRLVLNDVGAWIPAEGLRRILSYAGKLVRFNDRAEAESTLRRIWAPFGVRRESDWQHLFSHGLVENDDGSVRLAYDPAIVASLAAATDVSPI